MQQLRLITLTVSMGLLAGCVLLPTPAADLPTLIPLLNLTAGFLPLLTPTQLGSGETVLPPSTPTLPARFQGYPYPIFSPIASPSDYVSAIPAPTLTPRPTNTPTPTSTYTPIPTIGALIQSVSLQQLSEHLPYDVVFIDGPSLMLWQHETGAVRRLLECNPASTPACGGFQVKISHNSARMLVWHRLDDQQNELLILDRDVDITIPITRQVKSNASISPDGNSVAYVTDELTGTVYVASSANPTLATPLGTCAHVDWAGGEFTIDCSGLAWSADGQTLAWGDGYGIWIKDIATANPPRLLIEHHINYPTNNLSQDDIQIFRLGEWSPTGRYLLGWVNHYEGWERTIIDSQTGRWEYVPNTSEYSSVLGFAIGTTDGHLFSIHRGFYLADQPLTTILWRIHPEAEPMLQVEKTLTFTVSAKAAPIVPMQFADGSYGFGLISFDPTNYQDRGLWRLDTNFTTSHNMVSLPPMFWEDWPEVAMYWSPDGSGALVEYGPATLLYASVTEGVLYDVRSAFGPLARNFRLWPDP